MANVIIILKVFLYWEYSGVNDITVNWSSQKVHVRPLKCHLQVSLCLHTATTLSLLLYNREMHSAYKLIELLAEHHMTMVWTDTHSSVKQTHDWKVFLTYNFIFEKSDVIQIDNQHCQLAIMNVTFFHFYGFWKLSWQKVLWITSEWFMI